MEYRIQCLIALFKQGADNIAALSQRETWQIEYLNENGGVTRLVYKKFEILVNLLLLLRILNLNCA